MDTKKAVQLAYIASGLVLGAAAGLLPALTMWVAVLGFGRPSSTAILGLPIALLYGLAGATIGVPFGLLVHYGLAGTRWSGPPNGRLVAGVLVLIACGSVANAVYEVRQESNASRPRLILSTGLLTRATGASTLEPKADATVLYAPVPSDGRPVRDLSWNLAPVEIGQTDGHLLVRRGHQVVQSVDMRTFDYIREVVGVTVRFGSGTPEALVLLARLRATGRRELLIIVDATGALVHQELFERTTRLVRGGVVWRSGPEEGPCEITVDVGTPVRFALAR